MNWLAQHPIAIFGTLAVLVLGWLASLIGARIIAARIPDPRRRYSARKTLNMAVVVLGAAVVIILWSRLIPHQSTFLGLVGAGLAVALRDPLLAIAGRIAIFAGHMFSVGDRIEINQMKGDVIDVGLFYTRMMEVGNWLSADQVSGRTVQFSNSQLFGAAAVFNYTQNFSYIWDEIKLPLTYDSNVKAASQILLEVGGAYTRDFLQGAQSELEQMRRYFLVPKFELEPQVYIKVTDNYLELTMRYVVDPKKRRDASNFMYREVFERLQGRKDLSIGSSTMDLTVHGKTPRSSASENPGEQAA